MNVVTELERRLMPTLHTIAQHVRGKIPHIKVRVSSNGGGDLTPDPWHVMAVVCRLHEDWDNPPNEVMIQVAAYSVTSDPLLDTYVMWDYTFDVEERLFAQPVPASDEAIQMIEKFLPQLETVLIKAARRGHSKTKSDG